MFELGDKVKSNTLWTIETGWLDIETIEGKYIGDLNEEIEDSITSIVGIYDDKGLIERYLIVSKDSLRLA